MDTVDLRRSARSRAVPLLRSTRARAPLVLLRLFVAHSLLLVIVTDNVRPSFCVWHLRSLFPENSSEMELQQAVVQDGLLRTNRGALFECEFAMRPNVSQAALLHCGGYQVWLLSYFRQISYLLQPCGSLWKPGCTSTQLSVLIVTVTRLWQTVHEHVASASHSSSQRLGSS